MNYGIEYPEIPAADLEVDGCIKRIRAALKARSGVAWSVTRGKGSDYCWITITAPPARRAEYGYLSDQDRAALAKLLDVSHGKVGTSGYSVAASKEHRLEIIDRAEGRPPRTTGTQYWD